MNDETLQKNKIILENNIQEKYKDNEEQFFKNLQTTSQSPKMQSTTVLSPQWDPFNDRERNISFFSQKKKKKVHKRQGRTGHFLSHGRLD